MTYEQNRLMELLRQDTLSAYDEERVREFIEAIVAQSSIDFFDGKGKTPLYMAICHGRKAIVELLLQRGADVAQPDAAGQFPLHTAMLNGHVAIADLLLQYGADVQRPDDIVRPPLHLAMDGNRTAMIKLVLENGADPNPREYLSWTPLRKSIDRGYFETAVLLLKHGASLFDDTSGRLNASNALAYLMREPELCEKLIDKINKNEIVFAELEKHRDTLSKVLKRQIPGSPQALLINALQVQIPEVGVFTKPAHRM